MSNKPNCHPRCIPRVLFWDKIPSCRVKNHTITWMIDVSLDTHPSHLYDWEQVTRVERHQESWLTHEPRSSNSWLPKEYLKRPSIQIIRGRIVSKVDPLEVYDAIKMTNCWWSYDRAFRPTPKTLRLVDFYWLHPFNFVTCITDKNGVFVVGVNGQRSTSWP